VDPRSFWLGMSAAPCLATNLFGHESYLVTNFFGYGFLWPRISLATDIFGHMFLWFSKLRVSVAEYISNRKLSKLSCTYSVSLRVRA